MELSRYVSELRQELADLSLKQSQIERQIQAEKHVNLKHFDNELDLNTSTQTQTPHNTVCNLNIAHTHTHTQNTGPNATKT